MQWNLKTMWPAMATSLIAFTSLVNADQDNAQMRNLENRVTALEQKKGAGGIINPPARPEVKDGADFFIFGDLLVWNAHEGGLPFAVRNEDALNNLSDARIRTLHGQWNAGFRVGVGYNTPHDGWDLDLTYLRFSTRGHKSVSADDDDSVFPTIAASSDPIADNEPAKKAKGRWKLHLDQIDLDLGREFFVSKWLTLRPHFGLRADWVDQKFRTFYKNFTGTQLPNFVHARYSDDWWGIGPEGGIDTQWGLGRGFSLFGNLSAAIMYGIHKIRFKDADSPAQFNSLPNGTYARVKESMRLSHPILDLELGVRWDRLFMNDAFHFGLQVGWENHVYFGQNQFPIFGDDFNRGKFFANQGDLSFQGWTFQILFDF